MNLQNKNNRIFNKSFLIPLLGAFLFSSVAVSADLAKGQAKSATCGGCHGAQGIAIAPNFPNLAGQKAAYLAKSIRAYKAGTRSDPTMQAMVLSLTEEDIDNIAAYFSSLPRK